MKHNMNKSNHFMVTQYAKRMMSQAIPLSAMLGLSAILGLSAQAQTLVWSDEFNGTQLDANAWNIETGTGINGNWGTGQLDRATERPQNINFLQGVSGADGGVLSITTRKEFYIDRDYTSGRINTAGKVAFGPGYKIEARVWARDVRYQGQGFAFWMMPNEKPAGYDYIMWPQGGEVDIMEYVGSIPYHNLGTVHYAWFWENNVYQDWNHGHLGGYYSFKDQQGPDEPEWISVDLGSAQAFNQVILNWEGAYGKSYKIQVSSNNTSWSDIYSTTNGDGGVDVINAGGNARYVRMYGTERGTEWSHSLFEFEIKNSAGTNLALNRPVTVSSIQAPDLGGPNAVDGQYSTRWSSSLRNPGYGGYPPSPTNQNTGSYGWHTYGVNWYNDRIEFYVDGNVYHVHYLNDGAAFPPADGNDTARTQMRNGKRTYVSEYSNHFAEWRPFERQMYLILSSGVGGPSGYTYGGGIVPEAVFPVSTMIDWVRVYSLGGGQPPVLPPNGPNPPASTNLALSKPAVSSSNEGEGMAAGFAVDGNTNSRWASQWSEAQWIYVDLGSSKTISRVLLKWEAAYGKGYQIQVSENATNWTTVYSTTTGDGGVDDINLSGTGRYVRMNGTQRGTGYGYSLFDFEVYGSGGTTPPSNVNKALNKPASSSSDEGAAWGASQALDGNMNTRWASSWSDPQWIKVDLGSVQSISRVVLKWEGAFGKNYQVQTSSDNVNWTTVNTVTNGDGATDDLTLSGSGRYVRIYGTARGTGYGYSLWELEVY
jgi:hypothetical protein